jgi:hypothetical protein
MVPWLLADHSTGRFFYFYTVKHRFKGGANRLCTTLMRIFRASKFSNHVSRFARELCLVADNCSENKNNTLLAFASHLVMLGWYDEIEIVFGPVGHTHNGVDAQHQIHNEILGNKTSATFVHHIAHYCQSWVQPHSRPTPVLLQEQLDFDEFYAPYVCEIGGHTSTPTNPIGTKDMHRHCKKENKCGGEPGAALMVCL